jgi:hypothetical protein
LRGRFLAAQAQKVRSGGNLKASWQPRYVLLFSGHMVDGPDRDPPRFPNNKSPLARAAILDTLDQLDASNADLGVCGGACGGDLLFAELCLDRGMAIHLYLPFAEAMFLEKSVSFAGDEWTQRFHEVKNNRNTTLFVLTDHSEPQGANDNPYARNNLRMLYNVFAFGADKIRFIALWDGKAGDGSGGTKHMIESVRNQFGQVRILDTKQIFA